MRRYKHIRCSRPKTKLKTYVLGDGLQVGLSSKTIPLGILLLLQCVRSNPSSAQIDCRNLKVQQSSDSKNGKIHVHQPTLPVVWNAVSRIQSEGKVPNLVLWHKECTRGQSSLYHPVPALLCLPCSSQDPRQESLTSNTNQINHRLQNDLRSYLHILSHF